MFAAAGAEASARRLNGVLRGGLRSASLCARLRGGGAGQRHFARERLGSMPPRFQARLDTGEKFVDGCAPLGAREAGLLRQSRREIIDVSCVCPGHVPPRPVIFSTPLLRPTGERPLSQGEILRKPPHAACACRSALER